MKSLTLKMLINSKLAQQRNRIYNKTKEIDRVKLCTVPDSAESRQMLSGTALSQS